MINRKNQKGVVLPLTLVFLVIFGLTGIMLVSRFSGVGKKEYVRTLVDTKYYAVTQAGIDRARYQLVRPDDPSQKHSWSSGHKETFFITVNGQKVQVAIEDIEIEED